MQQILRWLLNVIGHLYCISKLSVGIKGCGIRQNYYVDNRGVLIGDINTCRPLYAESALLVEDLNYLQ